MAEQAVRKTFKYKLKPTPEQERMLDRAVMLCRHVYNAAIAERREAWQKCGVSVDYHQQKAELPGIKDGLPEYGEVHSQVLQDVVQRLDRAFQAFFRRVKAGETPGYPALPGTQPLQLASPTSNSATGPPWIMASWSCRRSAASRCAGPARWRARPRRSRSSREADGWYVCFSCADVPMQPLPPTGQETGIDLGLESFATLSDGTRIFQPGLVSQGGAPLKTAQRRVTRRKKGSNRRRKAVTSARQGAPEGEAAARTTSTIRRRWHWCSTTTRSITKTCRRPTCSRTTTSPSPSRTPAGRQFLSILSAKAACAGRTVVAVPPAYTSQTCSGCGVIVHERLVRPLAFLPGLRHEPASGPQRRQEHREAWAKPSGSRGVSRGGEPRIPRL